MVGKPLDRLGKPKLVVRVNWERLEEALVCVAFNSHPRRSSLGSLWRSGASNQNDRCTKPPLLKLQLRVVASGSQVPQGVVTLEHHGGFYMYIFYSSIHNKFMIKDYEPTY